MCYPSNATGPLADRAGHVLSRGQPAAGGVEWAEGGVGRSCAAQQESVRRSVLVKYGVVVWLDRRWPEDWTERWRTHQTEVNLIPRGMISFKFEPSYSCTFLLSLSNDEVSESRTLRRSHLQSYSSIANPVLSPPLEGVGEGSISYYYYHHHWAEVIA